MFVGFGNYYEGAGYFPGSQSRGIPKTGMLSEEATWSYDTTSSTGFDKYSAEKTKKDPTNGLAYVMIYCDDQEPNRSTSSGECSERKDELMASGVFTDYRVEKWLMDLQSLWISLHYDDPSTRWCLRLGGLRLLHQGACQLQRPDRTGHLQRN